MLSLILPSSGKSLQLLMENSVPVLFVINLSDGSVSGSFYKSSISEPNLAISDLSYTDTENKVFILIKHSNGFHKITYDVSVNLFTESHRHTGLDAYFVAVRNGYSFYGGLLKSESKPHASKLLGNGDVLLNPTLQLTPTTESFQVESSRYSLANDGSVTVTFVSLALPLDTVMSLVDIGAFVLATLGNFLSDIVLPTKTQEIFHVQENKDVDLGYEFACSASGATNIDSVLSIHPLSGILPDWISLSGDGTKLEIKKPKLLNGSDTVYLKLRFISLSGIIEKTIKLILFVCTSLHCDICKFESLAS